MSRPPLLLLAIAFAAILAACSGGGSDLADAEGAVQLKVSGMT